MGAAEVIDGSLLRQDFRSGQQPAGAPGAQGAQGAQGPKGDLGAKGDTGAAGTALAFARVQQDATLVGEASKNVVSVVTQPGVPGIYCFDLADGITPNVAVASGVRDAGTPDAIIETKLNNGGSNTNTCPVGNRDAQIVAQDASSVAIVAHAFYIIFD